MGLSNVRCFSFSLLYSLLNIDSVMFKNQPMSSEKYRLKYSAVNGAIFRRTTVLCLFSTDVCIIERIFDVKIDFKFHCLDSQSIDEQSSIGRTISNSLSTDELTADNCFKNAYYVFRALCRLSDRDIKNKNNTDPKYGNKKFLSQNIFIS